MTNCKNCGAPHTKTDKCNYCGTFYKPPPPKRKSFFDDDQDELPPIKSKGLSTGAKVAICIALPFVALVALDIMSKRRHSPKKRII